MAIAEPVSASQASDYYYEKDPFSAPRGIGENSEWYGNLAQAIGLIKETHKSYIENNDLVSKVRPDLRVKDRHFVALLSGLHPVTGEEIVPAGVNGERRAAVDICLSAPKSVSIAALVFQDSKIIQKHRQAVEKTLAYIESNFIKYRETVDGKTYTKDGDMLAATYLHTTSRANDPQLHTHAIVLNIVGTEEGGFKALHNDLIFKHQALINDIYQNELALGIKELGYQVVNYDNKFEIAGITDEAREVFSKRSKEIEETYHEIKNDFQSLTKSEVMKIATMKSRPSKNTHITAEELLERWKLENIKGYEPLRGESFIPQKDLIDLAIEDIHKTQSAFTEYQLLSTAIRQARGLKTKEEIESLIEAAKKDKRIVSLKTLDGGDNYYSTTGMIAIEEDISIAVNSGYEMCTAIIPEEQLPLFPENLTKGQRDFIKTVMTSKDKIMLIQGDAGTGKTYAVKILKDELEKINPSINIIGLGYTGKAAQELSDAASIETSTISSFLLSDKEVTENTIIIVDESSMVSSRDMHSLLSKSKNARIVLVGDSKQLQAIGAGKIFSELQREGKKHTRLEEVLRQKTDVTKSLVKYIKDFRDGNNEKGIEQAVKHLEDNGCIHELNIYHTDKEELSDYYKRNEDLRTGSNFYVKVEAVDEYFKSPSECMLLTTSRAEKNELNRHIRNRYLSKEQLIKQKTFTVKDNLNYSRNAISYKIGDILAIGSKEYDIKAIDIINNTLLIESADESEKPKLTPVNLFETDYPVYRARELTLTEGDKVMFTRNNKKLGVQNGLTGVINSIDDNGNIEVKTKDKNISFNINTYNNLDHAYAITIHKSQGATCKKGILVHSPDDRITTESFYVAATRVTDEFKVFTTDKKSLLDTAELAQYKTSTRTFTISDDLTTKLNTGTVKSAINFLSDKRCLQEFNISKLWSNRGILKGQGYTINTFNIKKNNLGTVAKYHILMQAAEEYTKSPEESTLIATAEDKDFLNRHIRYLLLPGCLKYSKDFITAGSGSIKLMIGDKIRIIDKHSDGEIFTAKVLIAGDGNLLVKTDTGITSINSADYYIDYAYTATPEDRVYTKKAILVHTDVNFTKDQLRSVAESAAEDIKLYTVDKEFLIQDDYHNETFSYSPAQANFLHRLSRYNENIGSSKDIPDLLGELNKFRHLIYFIESNKSLVEINPKKLWWNKGILKSGEIEIDVNNITDAKLGELLHEQALLSSIEEYLLDPLNTVMLANTSEDRTTLNKILRKSMLTEDQLAKSTTFNIPTGQMDLTVGEKILFTEDIENLGIKKGTTGTISYISSTGFINVKAIGSELLFNVENTHIDYAYALMPGEYIGKYDKAVFLHTDGKVNTKDLHDTALNISKEFKIFTTDKFKMLDVSEQQYDKIYNKSPQQANFINRLDKFNEGKSPDGLKYALYFLEKNNCLGSITPGKLWWDNGLLKTDNDIIDLYNGGFKTLKEPVKTYTLLKAVEDYIKNPEDNILLTNSEEDKNFLNTRIRELMFKDKEQMSFETIDSKIVLAEGDRILFHNKNEKHYGLILSINDSKADKDNHILIRLAEGEIFVNLKDYNVDYAHAVDSSDDIVSKNAILVHTTKTVNHKELYKASDNTTNKFKIITMDKNKLIDPNNPGFDKEYSCTPVHANFITRLKSYAKKNNPGILRAGLYNLENKGCLKEFNIDNLWRTRGILKGKNYQYKIDRYKMDYETVKELTKYHTRMQAIEEMLSSPDSIIYTNSPDEIDFINKTSRDRCILKETEQTFMINGAEIRLATGDRIILNEENQELNIREGTVGVINIIDKKGNLLIDTDNGKLNININNYNNIKYAYSIPLDESIKIKKIILLHTEDNINIDEFVEAASKASYEFSVYTTDKASLGVNKEMEIEKKFM